jgi:hypothetical protein
LDLAKEVRISSPGRIAAGAKRPELWAAAIALILSLQLIPQSHFYGDDYIQIGTLEGSFDQFGSSPFNLYAFATGSEENMQRMIESGPMPWFVHPQMKVRFFRPVSSALLALDHALFGMEIRAYRIQAIMWYLLLVLAFAAWARLMIPPAEGASNMPALFVAVLVFAVSDSHWLNVLWTAGRWVLVAAAFALAGCTAHLRWRLQGWRPGRYLSVISMALALLSGEVALAVFAYIAAYEFVSDRGRMPDRVKALVPLAALVAIYLIFYMYLGYGAAANDDYLNPLSNPVMYLTQLPGRMLAMCSEIFLWFNSGLWHVEPLRGRVALAGVGGLLIMVILLAPVYAFASAKARLAVDQILLGIFGSMLVLAAGGPGSRNLVIPFIGTAALIGIAFTQWWMVLCSRRGWIRGAALLVCLAALFIHLGLAPYRWITEPSRFKTGSDAQAGMIRNIDFTKESVPEQRTVFLTMHFSACWNGYFLRTVEGLAVP